MAAVLPEYHAVDAAGGLDVTTAIEQTASTITADHAEASGACRFACGSKRIRAHQPGVIFSTKASYHRWIKILLAIGPLSTVISMVMVLTDEKMSMEKKSSTLVALFWTTIGIFVLYACLLPKRYEVHASGEVVVVTYLFPHKFDGVVGAFENPPFEDDLTRPRLKFSVNCLKRVLVQRQAGKWDVLVSPKDPQGFIHAVEKVAGLVSQTPKEVEDL